MDQAGQHRKTIHHMIEAVLQRHILSLQNIHLQLQLVGPQMLGLEAMQELQVVLPQRVNLESQVSQEDLKP